MIVCVVVIISVKIFRVSPAPRIGGPEEPEVKSGDVEFSKEVSEALLEVEGTGKFRG